MEKKTETKAIIELKNVKLLLKSGLLINYGSFVINASDFVLIRGQNGSGKSTFFRFFKSGELNSYCKSLEGEIVYYDAEGNAINVLKTKEQAYLNRQIVDITQEDYFDKETVYVALGQSAIRAIENETKLAYCRKELLKKVSERIEYYYNTYLKKCFSNESLNRMRFKKVTSLSGGQRKMVQVLAGLIKAEVIKSNLILMDEPLNNLDSMFKLLINDVLADLRKKQDIAIMIITHCHVFREINREMRIEKTVDGNKVIFPNEITKYNKQCLTEQEYLAKN